MLPVEAQANVSIRLAPGQSTAEIAPVFERLLREAAPEGATVDVDLWSTGEPGYVDPASPAVQLALDAFEHVLGTRPILTRSGGSIPIVAALAERGVPAIVTGFTRPGRAAPLAEREHPRGGAPRRARDDRRAPAAVRGAWR